MTEQHDTKDAVGYQTRSLTRALSILDAVAAEKRALSVKDLHELLQLPKPTVSRLTRELAKCGYLRSKGRAYELGPKTFELGSEFVRQYRFHDVGRPQLEALAADLEQTAALALLAGGRIVHVLVVPSPRPVQYVTDVGGSAAAHATALGKALLSVLPEKTVESLLGDGELTAFTPNTIVDRRRLLAELKQVHARGFAIDDEETSIGLRCVAVAADLPGVGPAALSVSGPAADFREDTIPAYAEAVGAAVTQLEVTLAHAADYAVRPSLMDLLSA